MNPSYEIVDGDRTWQFVHVARDEREEIPVPSGVVRAVQWDTARNVILDVYEANLELRTLDSLLGKAFFPPRSTHRKTFLTVMRRLRLEVQVQQADAAARAAKAVQP